VQNSRRKRHETARPVSSEAVRFKRLELLERFDGLNSLHDALSPPNGYCQILAKSLNCLQFPPTCTCLESRAVFNNNIGECPLPKTPSRQYQKIALIEQRRIVAELDSLRARVDALKKLRAKTTAELDALLPSILTEHSEESYEYIK
jgi:hypothetical protein